MLALLPTVRTDARKYLLSAGLQEICISTTRFLRAQCSRFDGVKKGMSSDIRNRPIITSMSELSFETVFTRYYGLVYQLAYRYVGQSDEADDIAQEVFLRYYRVPPKANSEAEQRAWLCRVATNLGLNVLRSRQRRTNREERVSETVQRIAPEVEAQLNPEQHALAGEQAALVRSILAEMPERQQT